MMEQLDLLSVWLKTTGLSHFVNHYAWVWPICEIVHFIGLAMLVGMIGILDLRMLGVAKQLPVRPLNQFVKIGAAGFVLNIATGVMFYAGNPDQYAHNTAFGWKMLFVTMAGVNVALFYVTGLFRKVEALGPGDDAPTGAKLIAAASLFCWAGVMYMGRMLPYIGNAF